MVGLLVVLTGCMGGGITGDPPAGLIPDWTPRTGAAQSLLAHTGRSFQGHGLVAENNDWALYFYEATLGIIMRNVHTGAYMRSTVAEADPADNPLWQGLYMSGITVDVQVGTNVHPTRVNVTSSPHRINVVYTADGFAAEVYFPGVQIGFTLLVSLLENGFSAEIPQASIHEGDPNQTIGSLYIFPFLGSTRLGQDAGYMFIPDGQGALIKLQDNNRRFATGFAEPVFGRNMGLEVEMIHTTFAGFSIIDDPEQVLMPVFGMIHTEREIGFLGVISSGAENAMIEAWPNGASTAFDWITARFMYRHIFMQPLGLASGTVDSRTPRSNRVDAKITYLFVVGDQASYAGLAVAYRGYLAETGAFDNAVMTDFNVGITFLGGEQRDWALFRLNVPMTTFSQAEGMLRALADADVTGAFVRFDGWKRGGSTLSLPTRGFNPARNLGGARQLNRLRDTARELGGELVLLSDPITIITAANPLESLNAARRVTGRTAEFMGGAMRITTPTRTAEISEAAANEFARNNFVADLMGVGSHLTSYSEGGAFYCRMDCAVLMSQSINFFDAPALTGANANMWQYARALTHMPSRGSGYLYVYREVPFLAIATSGMIPVYLEYVNFQPNRRRFFMNLVETGARPMFLITYEDAGYLRLTNRNDVYTSEFELYRDQIIRYHHELAAIHAYIAGSSIINHVTEGNYVRVYYENGLRIYLNYGRLDAVINGVPVPAMDFVLIRG